MTKFIYVQNINIFNSFFFLIFFDLGILGFTPKLYIKLGLEISNFKDKLKSNFKQFLNSSNPSPVFALTSKYI